MRRLQNPHPDQPCPDSGKIERLIQELKQQPSDAAWTQFLGQYSQVLMKAARFHAPTVDLAQDCFLFICEKLVAGNYQKLQQFEPKRGVPFEAWLLVVSNNLARDWRRMEFGRKRLPSAVQAMGEFDQAVYVLKHMKQLDTPACLDVLLARYPRTTPQDLSEALTRLHRAFSPEARWHLSVVNQPVTRRHVSFESGFIDLAAGGTSENPERETEAVQESAGLRNAMAKLDPRDRLLLRLRFEYRRSFEEISSIAGCTNLHQARRQVDRALAKLRALMITPE